MDIELLNADHRVMGFRCDRSELDEWLTQRAMSNQASNASRTWVLCEAGTKDVVGFYAIATASILREELPGRARRNQPEPVPAILLSRLAVDAKHQTRGLGKSLLKHFLNVCKIVSKNVGVRLVLVHAKDEEAADWYKRFGFRELPLDLTLYMLVTDIP